MSIIAAQLWSESGSRPPKKTRNWKLYPEKKYNTKGFCLGGVKCKSCNCYECFFFYLNIIYYNSLNRGGLAERLKELQNRERSAISLWRHRCVSYQMTPIGKIFTSF